MRPRVAGGAVTSPDGDVVPPKLQRRARVIAALRSAGGDNMSPPSLAVGVKGRTVSGSEVTFCSISVVLTPTNEHSGKKRF